jgi:hypothetical protein
MRTAFAVLAAALCTASARAAISYTHFAHPKGDYALDYPSDWKRSLGLQAVSLRPPGRAGVGTGVALERYPFGKDSPKTPAAFIAGLKEDTIKKVLSDQETTVAGRASRRIALEVTAELKGEYGQKLAGPRREVYIVMPAASDGSYYVLRLAGVGRSFEQALPEFDLIAKKLVLSPSLLRPR